MRPDVLDLQAFYDSRQGQLVRRLITRQIRAMWPWLGGRRVLGLGYPTPFLKGLCDEGARVVAMMPSGQGCHPWPRHGPSRVALVREDDLPLADKSIDRVLLVHALETTDDARRLLREVWRVLADGGRMIVVVPNRRGLWCLSERTPFGQGRPYSAGQLDQALRDQLFSPQRSGRALYVPPSPRHFWLRTAVAWERVGLRLAPHFAGIVLAEAEKQVDAISLGVLAPSAKRRRYAPIPAGLARRHHPPARGRLAARDGAARPRGANGHEAISPRTRSR